MLSGSAWTFHHKAFCQSLWPRAGGSGRSFPIDASQLLPYTLFRQSLSFHLKTRVSHLTALL
jgi:hypothetical protein